MICNVAVTFMANDKLAHGQRGIDLTIERRAVGNAASGPPGPSCSRAWRRHSTIAKQFSLCSRAPAPHVPHRDFGPIVFGLAIKTDHAQSHDNS